MAALGAVLLTDPALVAPMFTGLFMEKMAGFLKLYFPVFLLGAVFGKVDRAVGVRPGDRLGGRSRSSGAGGPSLAIVAVCALLTYGGVSLFVVVFAVYPFAAELFRKATIPKRLIPATIALGAFTFTMDSPARHAADPEHHPRSRSSRPPSTPRPGSGIIGAAFILADGLAYLDWRRRRAAAAGEGYGADLINEPAPFRPREASRIPLVALLPLAARRRREQGPHRCHPAALRRDHSFVPSARRQGRSR